MTLWRAPLPRGTRTVLVPRDRRRATRLPATRTTTVPRGFTPMAERVIRSRTERPVTFLPSTETVTVVVALRTRSVCNEVDSTRDAPDDPVTRTESRALRSARTTR